jgi:hypothetical protein
MIGVTATCVAGGVTQAAGTDMYMCTDARGKTITGDQPPPECWGYPIRQLRSDGSLRRVIEPPLTSEQRAQKAAEERRKAEEDSRRRDEARRDRALLETYSDEKEIDEARVRAVEGRRAIIDRARKQIDELQRERKKLDDESEFYAGRAKPDRLMRAYETNAAMVKSQQKMIDDTESEMGRINERFDADRARFRALVQAGGKPAQRSLSTSSR